MIMPPNVILVWVTDRLNTLCQLLCALNQPFDHGVWPCSDLHLAHTGLSCTWWRHQMETFSLLALYEGNPPVTAGFASQTPVTRSFDISSDLCVNKRLSKRRNAGDLIRHRAHSDVTVMRKYYCDSIYCIPSRYVRNWWIEFRPLLIFLNKSQIRII